MNLEFLISATLNELVTKTSFIIVYKDYSDDTTDDEWLDILMIIDSDGDWIKGNVDENGTIDWATLFLMDGKLI